MVRSGTFLLVACVVTAWTRGNASRRQLLEALRHPLVAVRFAAGYLVGGTRSEQEALLERLGRHREE